MPPIFDYIDFRYGGGGVRRLSVDGGGALRFPGPISADGAIEDGEEIFRVQTVDQARVTFGKSLELVVSRRRDGAEAIAKTTGAGIEHEDQSLHEGEAILSFDAADTATMSEEHDVILWLVDELGRPRVVFGYVPFVAAPARRPA